MEIVMPRLSDSMEDGTVLKWLKADGDAVSRGEPLVEIETDKATMTYEADADGVLELVAAEGDTLPIGAVIARLGGNGAVAPSAPATPGGAPAVPEPGTAKGEVTLVELTRAQRVLARRMAESRATIPDFTLRAVVDMEGCVALRRELSELGRPVPATYNDMVVRACAIALRELPRVNASYRDGRVALHSRVNVGFAVAAQQAIVVPTVFDADAKPLAAIARETSELAARVREGTITPPQLSGGTFTVSNLGMYGVASFTAVINPPQAATLAVGSIEPRATVRDGGVVARHTMDVTLACDHRLLYGADAAEFLARVRELLERPLALTV